jgi:hypothetical protein
MRYNLYYNGYDAEFNTWELYENCKYYPLLMGNIERYLFLRFLMNLEN